ncbi:hypothetical protein RHMOL_Rhmol02G0188100 [Rhododendron molle]|uniref:Uncharacterized protein n=1 Tax=Rhododendron molle TaxID=49168 RepID=A0ACC0PT31_RHOML|nr:hypothetical protein RHMOL_Rhmol02G0188100 [Rhododendron molle]
MTIDLHDDYRSIGVPSQEEERRTNEEEEVLSMNEEEDTEIESKEMEEEVVSRANPIFEPPPPGVQSLDALQLVSPVACEPCESVGSSVPKMEQQFDNLDDVFKFYNNYAKQVGFSVRIHSSKVKDGEIIRKEYVCYKQGKRTPKSSKNSEAPTIRRRGIIRTDCRAKLSVVRNNIGEGFVVIQFLEAYNHKLTSPGRVHLLPSHPRMSAAARSLTKDLAAANVPPCQQMAILEVQAGGVENIGFTNRDLHNSDRNNRKKYAGHEANMLYEKFEIEKEKNPNFVFSFMQDDKGRLSRFWADAISRKSYYYFGDVVVFDTAYNTNRYSLVFTHILGVNHHGQTTLFGCAFLNEETTESFEWLLKEWLKAMPGGPPKMIITDQDPAMTKAIGNVLPNTLHRYCIWHITKKFSEKLGAVIYKEHYDKFSSCIWESERPEEFDVRWGDLLQQIDLTGHGWLNDLFEIRGRWIPAYTKQVRAKGCGKRLQGGKERAVNKKSRKCNGCGLTGQSHDKRNCPKLLNISSQDVDDEDDMDYEDSWSLQPHSLTAYLGNESAFVLVEDEESISTLQYMRACSLPPSICCATSAPRESKSWDCESDSAEGYVPGLDESEDYVLGSPFEGLDLNLSPNGSCEVATKEKVVTVFYIASAECAASTCYG